MIFLHILLISFSHKYHEIQKTFRATSLNPRMCVCVYTCPYVSAGTAMPRYMCRDQQSTRECFGKQGLLFVLLCCTCQVNSAFRFCRFCLHHLSHESTGITDRYLAFMWVQGSQIQVFTLTWQVLYTLRQPSSPYTYYLCVCTHMCILLGNENRATNMLGKCSITELNFQTYIITLMKQISKL